MFKVQKKNGQLEDFDRNHVYQSVMKAGGTNEEAEKITAEIETWLPGAVVAGVIPTQTIREKVLELLRPLNPVVAGDFEIYKKQV